MTTRTNPHAAAQSPPPNTATTACQTPPDYPEDDFGNGVTEDTIILSKEYFRVVTHNLQLKIPRGKPDILEFFHRVVNGDFYNDSIFNPYL